MNIPAEAKQNRFYWIKQRLLKLSDTPLTFQQAVSYAEYCKANAEILKNHEERHIPCDSPYSVSAGLLVVGLLLDMGALYHARLAARLLVAVVDEWVNTYPDMDTDNPR